MSIDIMRACRPLQMHSAAKSVLMALADRSDDAGHSWPSIDKLVEDTCCSKTVVIESIKWLEASRILTANRANGRHTTYELHVTAFSPSAQRTRSRSKPVRAADQTGTRSAPDPSAQRTRPVRAADTNPHESTGTHLSNPPTRVRDTKTASTDRFHEFWDAYPRKIGDKQGALKTWSKNRLDEKANQIIQTVKARVAGDHKWSDLQFVPYPATYLKQERWNDEWQTNAKRPSVRDSFANEIYTGTPENEFGF